MSVEFDTERAEAAIDALIGRRAQEAEEANRVEALWAESCRTYNLRAAAERREAWISFHRNLERVHARLAEDHRAAVRQLMDGAARS